MQIPTAPLWSKTEEVRGRSVCSRVALCTVHGGTGHFALCRVALFTCRVALGTVLGGTAGQLFSTSENPSCKLLCQPSRINLVFLILPVLPVLLSAHVVFVNISIVDVVVVYSQAGELCFQKAFMAKGIAF